MRPVTRHRDYITDEDTHAGIVRAPSGRFRTHAKPFLQGVASMSYAASPQAGRQCRKLTCDHPRLQRRSGRGRLRRRQPRADCGQRHVRRVGWAPGWRRGSPWARRRPPRRRRRATSSGAAPMASATTARPRCAMRGSRAAAIRCVRGSRSTNSCWRRSATRTCRSRKLGTARRR